MLYRRFFDLLPYLRRSLLTAAAFSLVLELLKILPPYLVKNTLDLLLSPAPELSAVMASIGAVFVVSVLATFLEDHYVNWGARKVFTMETDLLTKGYAHVLTQDLQFFEDRSSGELSHCLTNGAVKLRELIWFYIDQFIGALFQLLLTSVLLMWIHPLVGGIFTLVMPLTVYLVVRTGKRVQPHRERYHARYRRAVWELQQGLMNIRTVKDFAQEAKEYRRFSERTDEYRSLAFLRLEAEGSDARIRDLILAVGRFAVIGLAVYYVFQGQMTAGTLVLFITLSEKMVASLFRLGRLYSYLGDSVQAIRKLLELFDVAPSIRSVDASLPLPPLQGEVRFEQVGFSYGNGAEALHRVDLVIPARSVCALVGRSGSGKSTLVKLLLRHYDVSQGRLLIDGHDIRELPLSAYRQRIAVVSQDIELFDASLYENIAYGVSSSREEIEEAARRAHAHEFIEKLPQGYDTVIGERGVRLSGGQKQRVGIARALLMKPTILVFDEATSALDTESERLIQEAMSALTGVQTMIIIAHRLSTIEKADMIVVVDNGRIAEVGTHEELVAHRGIFHKMQRLQSVGEVRA